MRKILFFVLLLLASLSTHAAYRSSSKATGTSDTVSVAKPAGLADGDTVTLAVRDPGQTAPTITWPSGFTQRGRATNSGASAGRAESISVATKENVTAASEPANYSISTSGGGGSDLTAEAVANSGRANSAPTVTTTNDAGTGTSTVSIPLAGGTAATGDDAIWFGAISYNGASSPWVTTPPAGYTLRQDQGDTGAFYGGNIGGATKDALSSGAIGTLTGSAALASASADSYGIVILLPASGGGGTVVNPITNKGGAAASPITLQ
jgi:hypothetical protein